MWHWLLDHGSAFDDIGIAWVIPVLVILVATRLFRPGYHRSQSAPIPVRTDEPRDESNQPRSAA